MTKPGSDYILLGCPFDNGIRSMLRYRRGTTGAAHGPDAILDALRRDHPEIAQSVEFQRLDLADYNLPIDPERWDDFSFIEHQLDATLQAHADIEDAVRAIVADGRWPIGVGGDHSVSYPLARGIMRQASPSRWGLIYIDVHLDLRAWNVEGGEDVISSGNTFWRLLEDSAVHLKGSNVVAIGVQPSHSPVYRRLRDRAQQRDLTIIPRHEITLKGTAAVAERALEMAGRDTDAIYLSLDMDAFDASVAPGVSAPNDHGLTKDEGLDLLGKLAQDTRVKSMDAVETSSRETAWFEIVKTESRDESPGERADKLERTAFVAADAIQRFINAKTAPSSH